MTDLSTLLDQGFSAVVGAEADAEAEAAAISFAAGLAPRTIRHRDGRPYLTRYYLAGGPVTPDPFDEFGSPRAGVRWPRINHGLYLHHFHSSDIRRLHNHPWDHAESLMLSGGYVEHRPDAVRTVLPGDRTTLGRDTYHRVELIGSDAWTLFAVGKFVGKWGYLSSFGGAVAEARSNASRWS